MYVIFFLIVCAGVVLLVLQQQGKLPNSKLKKELPTAERNIFNLEIGDIVQYEGIDWFIEGKLIYNDGSDSWFSYLLQDNEAICWLSVEEDDLVEVSIFHQRSGTIPQPLPTNINYLGENYNLSQSGTATMRRLGNTLNRHQQTCNYYDYKGNGNLRLSVEIWDGDIEISVGQKINPRMLNFLPGDGQKVYG
jgi:hypothetical protein